MPFAWPLAHFVAADMSKPHPSNLRAIEGRYEGLFLGAITKKSPEIVRAKRVRHENLFGVGDARTTGAAAAAIMGEPARAVAFLDLVQSGYRLLMIRAGIEAGTVTLTG